MFFKQMVNICNILIIYYLYCTIIHEMSFLDFPHLIVCNCIFICVILYTGHVLYFKQELDVRFSAELNCYGVAEKTKGAK